MPLDQGWTVLTGVTCHKLKQTYELPMFIDVKLQILNLLLFTHTTYEGHITATQNILTSFQPLAYIWLKYTEATIKMYTYNTQYLILIRFVAILNVYRGPEFARHHHPKAHSTHTLPLINNKQRCVITDLRKWFSILMAIQDKVKHDLRVNASDFDTYHTCGARRLLICSHTWWWQYAYCKLRNTYMVTRELSQIWWRYGSLRLSRGN
jgi:hypothetical protein